MKALVLASSSPRRQELLRQIGLKFIVHEPNLDETFHHQETVSRPRQACLLAVKKAKEAQKKYPESIIIGADTLVSMKEKILGKPATKRDALQMLAALNGKEHVVITGIALAYRKKILTNSSTTKVWFQKLPISFLEWYVETGEPMDKAGGYGIQGKGALLVEKIKGDYFNVVGLPLIKVWKLLLKIDREFLFTG